MAFGAEGVNLPVPDEITNNSFAAATPVAENNSPAFTINLMSGITDFSDMASDVFEGIENLTGSAYNDYLVGNAEIMLLMVWVAMTALKLVPVMTLLTQEQARTMWMVEWVVILLLSESLPV